MRSYFFPIFEGKLPVYYGFDFVRGAKLQRLSEIVGGRNAPEEISALERDLALEKLRGLYDAVRFGGVADAQLAEEPAPEAAFPTSTWAVGALARPGCRRAAAVPDDGPAFGGVAGGRDFRCRASGDSAGIRTGASSFPLQESAGSVPGAAGSRSGVRPVRVRLCAGDGAVCTVRTRDRSGCGVRFRSGNPSQRLIRTACPAPAVSGGAGSCAGGGCSRRSRRLFRDPVAEPRKIAQPSADSVSEGPVSADPGACKFRRCPGGRSCSGGFRGGGRLGGSAAEGTSHPAAPTLFGLEEATLRHRHKQRVIMSLYDTAEPAPKPAPHSLSQGLRPQRRPRPDSVRENSAGAAFFARGLRVGRPQRGCGASGGRRAGGSATGGGVRRGFSRRRAPGAGAGGPDAINDDVQTLADTIAPPRDIASELRRSEPVTDLHRAIGINDKFLMIRDLFGGDGEAFDAALDALNGFGDLDDCMIYIAENYAWNANSDGAKLLMELLERKFA